MSRAAYYRAYRARRKEQGKAVARGARTALSGEGPIIAWDGEGVTLQEPNGPAQRDYRAAVDAQAREMVELARIEADPYLQALRQNGGAIVPDLIRTARGWKMRGEFADVARRWLRPNKHRPIDGVSYGNIDAISASASAFAGRDISTDEVLQTFSDAHLVPTLREARDNVAASIERPSFGRHVYTLLANSTGAYIENPQGLSTLEIFTFLVHEAARLPSNAIHVGFATSYDVNMILGDLTQPQLRMLYSAKNHRSIVHGGRLWRILMRLRKSLYLALHDAPAWSGGKPNIIGKMTLWDVFGFFQSSFVKACLSWLTPEEQEEFDVDRIAAMKAKRSSFTTGEADAVRAYCFSELRALVRIVERLREHLWECDLHVARWDGAGAVAAAIYSKHGTKEAKSETPLELRTVFASAYAGGRIEIAQIGLCEQRTYDYDVRSAYPSAMVELPSLADGAWARTDKPEGFCVARVRWELPSDMPWYPLWYRHRDGTISFPTSGEGWYWRPEVDAALAFAQRFGGRVDVLDVWRFTGGEQTQPFGFVRDLYEKRAQWKREGRGAEKVLKLGLNSLYGKMAQQLGGDDKPPPYYQIEWAGWITSRTRAALVQASMSAPESVIMFATDGIFTTKPLDVSIGAQLGQWEVSEAGALVVAQAGVYWYARDASWTERSRGFDAGSIDHHDVLRAWKQGETAIDVPLTRFVTLGSALTRAEGLNQWRTWVTEPRRLDISGSSPKRRYDRAMGAWKPHRRFVPLRVRHNLEYETTGVISWAYPVSFWPDVRAAQTIPLTEREIDHDIYDTQL